jgi:replication-associated recombination protein RarA
MVFFWGPPAVGKSTVAKIIAQKTNYHYIDYEEFGKEHKCKTQQEITNHLIEYCTSTPHMCIVVDSFFVDAK